MHKVQLIIKNKKQKGERKMLKKKVSFLTALVMLLTLLVGGVPAVQAKEGFVASGYTIIDSAYGNGTYVVMAKNLTDTNHATKIYSSANGKNWTETFSVSDAKNYAENNAKQELLYWKEESQFVAALGSSVYVSTDAMTWTKNDDLSMSNAIVDNKDGILVVAGNWNVRVAASLTDIKAVDEVLHKDKYYAQFIGIASADKVFIAAKDEGATIEKSTDESNVSWARTARINNQTVVPFNPIDEKFVEGQSKWIILPKNSAKIATMTYSGYAPKVHAPLVGEGTENSEIISAIGADATSMFFGTENGKIYYIAADANLTAIDDAPADIWQAAVPANGTTAISEEVTDITAIGNNEFFVTTATGVYNMKKTADGYVYSDMLAYKTIEEAKLIGTLPFDGVTILGGAYSPELDIYVVYGNDADKKGYIFYSEDGINWNTTGVGTQTLTWGFESKAKNVAVWWPAKEMFVISAATDWKDADNNKIGATQTCWYSKDGKSWSWMDKNGFGDNGDISVMGDYLYTSYKGSNWAIRRFSALDRVVTNIFYTIKDSNNQACTTMAVSDDEVPVVLVGAGYGQTFVNKATLDRNAVTKANLITPGGTGASSQMRDVHWNTNIDKFVGINSANSSVYLIDANANVESFVPNSESGILAAIETNNSSYLTGGANGTIYYSAGANISTASTFTEVQTAGTKNTLPVTNIFVGKDNKYFVTVSDGTESDILVVSADGSGYQKLSELVTPTSISAGDTFKISVKTTNYTERAENIRLIAAIYDSTGKTLLQVTSEGKTMQLNTSEVLTMDVTAGSNVTSDCKVKVFIWDSINGMTPVAGEAKSFF